ncbi:MAG: transcriptional repressor NrdR [Phycisphaerae bacterium]|nr:transcriptional repressor NrdR [Phycisphaerae bacterium]
MRCPSCKEVNKDKVIDSRATDGGAAIRRRRLCTVCKRRFTTKERIEEELRLAVIKNNGTRVPYRREKLLVGIDHACYKLPLDVDCIDELVDAIEGDIFKNHDREVTSAEIGECVARRLRKLNHIAYVRFMSVYRKFKDVDEFIDEIREVKARAAVESPAQQTLFDETD